jgi:hypothetical protein
MNVKHWYGTSAAYTALSPKDDGTIYFLYDINAIYKGSTIIVSGTTASNITGNAATATKLQTPRTIAITGGATGTATAFDGSNNISIPITDIRTEYLSEPTYSMDGFTRTSRALFDSVRANRLAFLPADQIIIEQSTDAGSTWSTAGINDTIKANFFSDNQPQLLIPLKNGVQSTDCMLRITITP